MRKVGEILGISCRRRHNGGRLCNLDAMSVGTDPCRTVRPNHTNGRKPLLEHSSEGSRARVLDGADLIRQTEAAEQGNRFHTFGFEAAVRQPHIENEHRG